MRGHVTSLSSPIPGLSTLSSGMFGVGRELNMFCHIYQLTNKQNSPPSPQKFHTIS